MNAEPNSTIGNNQTEKAKEYNRKKLILSIAGMISGIILLSLFIIFHYNIFLDQYLRAFISNDYIRLCLFAGIIWAGEFIILSPLNYYQEFILEHRYGLSHQNFWGWLWQNCKAILISAILGIPILLVFYYLLRNTGNLWWLYLGFFLFLFSVVLGRIAPVLIFPLFYKLQPVREDELGEKIHRLAEDAGLNISGVYTFNLSKDTRKANAAFTGLGKSKRVLLGDTLIKNFSDEEIMAVLCHELGHFKKRHTHKMIITGAVFTFLGLFLAAKIYSFSLPFFGLESITEIASLPLLILILMLYGFITTPMQNIISRKFERDADKYVVETSPGLKEAFIQSLQKLSEINLADQSPHPLVEFLFHSHPSIRKRVDYLQRLTSSGQR